MHWPGTNEAVMIDSWRGMEDLYKTKSGEKYWCEQFYPRTF